MHVDVQQDSIWTDPDCPAAPFPDGARVAVCVVGAGLAGLSVAYHLARAGRAVLVLDDGPVGGGNTSRTTAHLASAIDDRFYNGPANGDLEAKEL
jgi:glycine/D-amino acid oxidase-like deaminating enzyme